MDRNVTRIGAIAALVAGMTMAGGCARQDSPPAQTTTADNASAGSTLPAEISIPGTRVLPESITSRSDGTLYIGSVGQSQIYRVAPGASSAEVFVQPGTGDVKQVFGVFADESSGTLWACSNELPAGPPGAAPPGPSALHGFDLDAGSAKASHPLPQGAMCNDITVGPNGDVYATDTQGMLIYRLPSGGNALEAWSPQGAFGPPGGVLDGIAMVNDRVIVNTLATSKLFAVDVGTDGKAGRVVELTLSAPVSGPDGMRSHGANGLLTTDGNGKVHHVTISGDSATVTTVKEGLEGPVSVTPVGNYAYAVEGQLGLLFGNATEEKPYRAVGFPLP